MASCLHLITLLSVAVLASAHDDCCTRCPSGWTQFGNRCFIVHYSPLPMAEAEVVCLKEGGNLASYHNQAEVNFVNGHIKRISAKTFNTWNGLYDGVQKGYWFWSDGSKFSFRPWAKGEPNNSAKGEDCAELYPTGHFNDIACTHKRSFVCSKGL